jgi:recombinational DNA repair ATPase RecF
MENIFITNIKIGRLRNLQTFNIEVSKTDKKHLILTGKNGSGKTSLLEAMRSIMFDIGKKFTKNKNNFSDKNLWEIGVANIVPEGIKNIEPMSLNIIFSGIKSPY